jgi:hypothetical protein
MLQGMADFLTLLWGGIVVSEEEISRTRYIIITLAPSKDFLEMT